MSSSKKIPLFIFAITKDSDDGSDYVSGSLATFLQENKATIVSRSWKIKIVKVKNTYAEIFEKVQALKTPQKSLILILGTMPTKKTASAGYGGCKDRLQWP